ncbi:hypothetical protein U91I_02295 [alpha proteobacterium U9-1i]|nr:hypothetical protein U91I_02295 [alpha proteobacterium U9-1i]
MHGELPYRAGRVTRIGWAQWRRRSWRCERTRPSTPKPRNRATSCLSFFQRREHQRPRRRKN